VGRPICLQVHDVGQAVCETWAFTPRCRDAQRSERTLLCRSSGTDRRSKLLGPMGDDQRLVVVRCVGHLPLDLIKGRRLQAFRELVSEEGPIA
jgi:hypothetical protein